jgi:hypothetical protein
LINRTLNLKKATEKLKDKRSAYQNQFCLYNSIIFSKKIWRYLKKHEINCYNNNNRIYFNPKTLNLLNIIKGINLDCESFTNIMSRKFLIQSFIDTFDSFRCTEIYTQILQRFKLNKRISDELIIYARKKKVSSLSQIKENFHFITLFKSGKIYL